MQVSYHILNIPIQETIKQLPNFKLNLGLESIKSLYTRIKNRSYIYTNAPVHYNMEHKFNPAIKK